MDLELKRLQVDYKRVNAAREELEFRILEFQDQIKRLEENISKQKSTEEELLLKIQNYEQKK